jgi:hypothetical protein
MSWPKSSPLQFIAMAIIPFDCASTPSRVDVPVAGSIV